MGWQRGVVSFLLHRGMDCVIPGSGLAMDLMDAGEILKAGYDAGTLSYEQLRDFNADLESAARNGRDLVENGQRPLKVHRQACSVCKKIGHNKRTCPRR
ncbi:hypothetical protein T492DRAFT_861145 [Pavlovales sp. CCMP2436]|nr:hypothetical protein T492DRAFT_861145 [Pavlovales sp. CCMP2436]